MNLLIANDKGYTLSVERSKGGAMSTEPEVLGQFGREVVT